jgi:hypothetical protein
VKKYFFFSFSIQLFVFSIAHDLIIGVDEKQQVFLISIAKNIVISSTVLQLKPKFLQFTSLSFFVAVCEDENLTRILLFDFQCNLVNQDLVDGVVTDFSIYSSTDQKNYLLIIVEYNQFIIMDSFELKELQRFHLEVLVRSIFVLQNENIVFFHTKDQKLLYFPLFKIFSQ